MAFDANTCLVSGERTGSPYCPSFIAGEPSVFRRKARPDAPAADPQSSNEIKLPSAEMSLKVA